jgi:hypothetical protein
VVKEQPRLAQQQRLLLRLIADVEHRDIGPQDPALARLAFGIGPDEPLAADPEVEAVAVDLLHVRQRQRQPAHVLGISHAAQARTW